MLDLPLPILPTTGARGVPPGCPSGNSDLSHPFALTLSRRAPADLMSGRAAPLVLARFATLADAMLGAIDHAEGMATNTAPQLLAIFDRDERLVPVSYTHLDVYKRQALCLGPRRLPVSRRRSQPDRGGPVAGRFP